MAVRITVDTRDLADLKRRVTSIIEVAGRTRMRQDLAATALRQHQQRFIRRVDPEGVRWQDRVDDKPHPLLERTGRMRRSIRAVPEGDGITVSADTPYAAVHQHGSDTIPARPFLGFGGADLAELTETAEAGLARFVGETL